VSDRGTGPGRPQRRLTALLVALACLVPVPAAAAQRPSGELAAGAAAASVLGALADAAPSVADAAPGDVIADRLLVTFDDEVPIDRAEAVLAEAGVDGRVEPGYSVAVVEVDPADAPAAVVALSTAEEVESVRPDRLLDFAPSSDALRHQQWWWRNEAQQVRGSSGEVEPGTRDLDIGAAAAWLATRGRPEVVVAIVDTGFDVDHPDLRANVWRNPAVGADGCANDLHGRNFSWQGGCGQVYANATDDQHGTHVAGIVAAAEDGVGTVGVAPRVQLMSVKFLVRQQGRVSDGIRAIQYATRAGADVINASWGVPGDGRAHPDLDRALRDARIPVVVAAGNTGSDLARFPEFPAVSAAPNVITVTAVDNRGRIPGFSAYSTRYVDVAAPGVSILSTFPVGHVDGLHGTLDGTSQAAPMVTGAVALAISATGVRDGATLAAAVRAGARPLGSLGDPSRPSGASAAGLASAPGTLRALGVDLGACRGGAPRAPFSDLVRSDVHTASVDCVVHRGLASGYPDGTYHPRRTVTRGQVASFLAGLVRTSRDLAAPTEGRFRDLDGIVHRDNIEALAARGIIDGYADGTYRPGAKVTREQFATLLVRTYEQLVGGRIRPSDARFPDVVGSVHEPGVRAATTLGFVEGRSADRFDPRSGVNRAQLGSLLRRALDKLVNDRVATLP
jgi:subtilisin family serine protease